MSRQQNELPALFMDQSFKKNALNLSFFFEKYETEKTCLIQSLSPALNYNRIHIPSSYIR